LDKGGHVKLSDFGLCKHVDIQGNKMESIRQIASQRKTPLPRGCELDITNQTHDDKRGLFKRSRLLAFSTVGTPDYIAPEVFGEKGYNELVD